MSDEKTGETLDQKIERLKAKIRSNDAEYEHALREVARLTPMKEAWELATAVAEAYENPCGRTGPHVDKIDLRFALYEREMGKS